MFVGQYAASLALKRVDKNASLGIWWRCNNNVSFCTCNVFHFCRSGVLVGRKTELNTVGE